LWANMRGCLLAPTAGTYVWSQARHRPIFNLVPSVRTKSLGTRLTNLQEWSRPFKKSPMIFCGVIGFYFVLDQDASGTERIF
jgi:hypothetical protein